VFAMLRRQEAKLSAHFPRNGPENGDSVGPSADNTTGLGRIAR
jgi:hypothetical protein